MAGDPVAAEALGWEDTPEGFRKSKQTITHPNRDAISEHMATTWTAEGKTKTVNKKSSAGLRLWFRWESVCLASTPPSSVPGTTQTKRLTPIISALGRFRKEDEKLKTIHSYIRSSRLVRAT